MVQINLSQLFPNDLVVGMELRDKVRVLIGFANKLNEHICHMSSNVAISSKLPSLVSDHLLY